MIHIIYIPIYIPYLLNLEKIWFHSEIEGKAFNFWDMIWFGERKLWMLNGRWIIGTRELRAKRVWRLIQQFQWWITEPWSLCNEREYQWHARWCVWVKNDEPRYCLCFKNRRLLEKFSMLIEVIKQRKNNDAEERRFN